MVNGMSTYKHFVTISSQLYFCSSPIRLDSYNRCQFGCVYCFSRRRATETSERGLKEASPAAFAKRLERVDRGLIRSALDEFLSERVPIQLGGLQDPFSPMEAKRGITRDLLRILRESNYPTLISTKGELFLRDDYLNELAQMNVYIRLSAAAVPESARLKIDVGGDRFAKTLKKIALLASHGFPVSLRIQPVFPGFESVAIRMADQAAGSGAKHISFEFLKLGTEGMHNQCTAISRILNVDILDSMQSRGMKRVGRDYTLVSEAKRDFVRLAKATCKKLGVKFGAGDTEFIHLSDGRGCCNGSSFFLKKATQFRSNFVGVLSNRKVGDLIRLSDVIDEWHPRMSVHSYLTTDSRGRDRSGRFDSWCSLVAHRWNGGRGPYCPEFFYGVSWTGMFDNMGFKIYRIAERL